MLRRRTEYSFSLPHFLLFSGFESALLLTASYSIFLLHLIVVEVVGVRKWVIDGGLGEEEGARKMNILVQEGKSDGRGDKERLGRGSIRQGKRETK